MNHYPILHVSSYTYFMRGSSFLPIFMLMFSFLKTDFGGSWFKHVLGYMPHFKQENVLLVKYEDLYKVSSISKYGVERKMQLLKCQINTLLPLIIVISFFNQLKTLSKSHISRILWRKFENLHISYKFCKIQFLVILTSLKRHCDVK